MEFGTARIPQRSIFLPYWFGSSELWFVQTIEICLVVWNIWITVFFSIWTSSKFHQQKRRQMIQDGDPTPTICWTFSWDFLDWNIWIIFHILGIIIPTDFIFSLGIAASFLSKKTSARRGENQHLRFEVPEKNRAKISIGKVECDKVRNVNGGVNGC